MTVTINVGHALIVLAGLLLIPLLSFGSKATSDFPDVTINHTFHLLDLIMWPLLFLFTTAATLGIVLSLA